MFTSEAELEERLTTPSAALVNDLGRDQGDLVILGAGGKMGPTLAVLARRALDAAGRENDSVFAVSRWSDDRAARALAERGVRTVTADLVEDADLSGLPDAADVIFMVGAKFGTSTSPYLAWAVNAATPDRVSRRYAESRIAAFSTGNVYPLTPPAFGGSVETDPVSPVGEYAMSCLGRERIFEHAAATFGTRVSLIRLNYAVDLRYGVLADLGRRILAGAPIDLTTNSVNVVWQGYANEVVLRSLGHASTQPFVLNLTGPETLTVRRMATGLAAGLGLDVAFEGTPAADALLSDASKCHRLFGYPDVPAATLVSWQAEWLNAGLPLIDKLTKFDVRDGRF